MAPNPGLSRRMKNVGLLALAVVLAALPQAAASPLDAMDALGPQRVVYIEVNLPEVEAAFLQNDPPLLDVCSSAGCNPQLCAGVKANARTDVDPSFVVYVEVGPGSSDGAHAGYSALCQD